MPGPQPQVEGVAEDDLRAHRLERRRHHALDGAVGAHRHERRRLDHAVVEREAAAPRVALVASSSNSHAMRGAVARRGCGVTSIASP